MGKVIQFIQDSGEGRYTCFKTQKMLLDTSVTDVLTYDDKTSSHAKRVASLNLMTSVCIPFASVINS